MPKLWSSTIEEHRHEVRSAVFTATTSLLHREGLRGLTMSRIAEEAGIGRATLYKYFPDVDAIVGEWHHDQVGTHLAELRALAEGDAPAVERLHQVMTAFLHMAHGIGKHSAIADLATSLHGPSRMHEPEAALANLLADLLKAAGEEGAVRTDVPADELAAFCLQAMTAARQAKNGAALSRLQDLVMDGIVTR